ncbi:hypothetical protein IEQ34_015108 [Dendrobium chrysotoxum]|uniref:Uncharacterized protein n=1 Tax=Dendrobium chrysotoxum TaxID=161865 RepID=A0AAV7GKY9_DENCH|nr:hypothetical protein IEQ34_015108 [Dendrobium chrysotoxum]
MFKKKAKIQKVNGKVRDITDKQGGVVPISSNVHDQSNIIVNQENSDGLNLVVDIPTTSIDNMLYPFNVSDVAILKGNINNHGLTTEVALCNSSPAYNDDNFLNDHNVEAVASEPSKNIDLSNLVLIIPIRIALLSKDDLVNNVDDGSLTWMMRVMLQLQIHGQVPLTMIFLLRVSTNITYKTYTIKGYWKRKTVKNRNINRLLEHIVLDDPVIILDDLCRHN